MADLADERDFLLRSLRDLDAEKEAGDIDPEDYDVLRDGYTARAAAVIRELAQSTAPETPPEAAPAPKKGRARLVVAGAIAGAGILAGVVLARNAGTRLPGDTVSGETPTISPAAGLDAQAQQQISKGDLLGAIKTFDSVLKTTPNDAEALAYKGWLLRLAGSQGKDPQLIDAGLASIRQAEAADPSYPDAHFFAGETLLRDKQDPKGAIVEFQQFLADNPPQSMVAEVQLELQSAQAMAKG
jgi:tetratricopeptide (TPR) repeat protein